MLQDDFNCIENIYLKTVQIPNTTTSYEESKIEIYLADFPLLPNKITK